MQENKEKNNNTSNKDKGIVETIKQVNYQNELKRQERFEKKNEAEREEYGKRNAEEKVEVIKVRQGVSDGSDTLFAREETERTYTFSQKVGNFFYHNKWWLIITVFLVLIAGFLTYDLVMTVRPDVRLMYLTSDGEMYMQTEKVGEYMSKLVKDYNEDDKNLVDVVYIPVSSTAGDDTAFQNSMTALSNQFQLGETMLILGDKDVDEFIAPESTLEDLSVYFPDNSHVKGCKYMLKGTGFARKIGMNEDDLPDDLYLGVRRIPEYNLSAEETNKDNHANAVETLKTIVRDLN